MRRHSTTTAQDFAQQQQPGEGARLLDIAETYRAVFRAGQASAYAIGRLAWALGTLHKTDMPATAVEVEQAYNNERAWLAPSDVDALAMLSLARDILLEHVALRRDWKKFRA